MHRSARSRFALVAVQVLGLGLAPGCFLLPPANDLHGGETLYLTEDSLVLEVMGPGLHKEDHRKSSAATARPVLPAGAVVHVASDYEKQRALNAPDAPLANHNPWILVEVVASPVPAQVGWKGWIHLGTTASTATTSAPLGNARTDRAARLCAYADANDLQCPVNLGAQTPLRVLGCSANRAEVELWTAEGAYLHGFVNVRQLARDAVASAPCSPLQKD